MSDLIYNPDGSRLRTDQLELLHMLQFLKKICEQHGITWWLSSGTLLGAARHQGFIPWDDDMDIVMLKKDYNRLKKILLNLNSDEYVFHSQESDVDYVYFFGKFRKRDGCVSSQSKRFIYYKWKGIGFDIFAIEKTNYFSAYCASVIYDKLQSFTSNISYAYVRKPLIKGIELACNYFLFPILRLIGLYNPNNEYHYTLGTGWPKHVFFMKYTFPLTEALFEGQKMPVPFDVDSYLTNVYGDWRKKPSEEQIRKSIHCKEYIEEIFGKSH